MPLQPSLGFNTEEKEGPQTNVLLHTNILYHQRKYFLSQHILDNQMRKNNSTNYWKLHQTIKGCGWETWDFRHINYYWVIYFIQTIAYEKLTSRWVSKFINTASKTVYTAYTETLPLLIYVFTEISVNNIIPNVLCLFQRLSKIS